MTRADTPPSRTEASPNDTPDMHTQVCGNGTTNATGRRHEGTAGAAAHAEIAR